MLIGNLQQAGVQNDGAGEPVRRRNVEPLREALNTNTLVAAVGPVCRMALEASGVNVDLEPPHPEMGALVAALAAGCELHDRATASC